MPPECLVAIDLKIGEFEAAYKGQMELYPRYLEKHEPLEGENTPIGLILWLLCHGQVTSVAAGDSQGCSDAINAIGFRHMHRGFTPPAFK